MKRVCMYLITSVIALTVSPLFSADMLERVESNYTEAAGKALIAEIGKSNNTDNDLYCGIVFHNLANAAKNEQRESYALKAISLLSKYKDTNPVGCAYLGSTITIMGSVNSQKKKLMEAVKNLEEGARLIDSAVAKSPENISVRMVRLQNAVGVSKDSPIKRWKVARTDIDYLKTKESKLNNVYKADLYFYSGETYLGEKKTNEAIREYAIAVKFAPESVSGVRARNNLAKYSE